MASTEPKESATESITTPPPEGCSSRPFWGVGDELDATWMLTEPQRQLQAQLIELCRRRIRPHAVQCDQNYTFPRQSLDALAELGLLGLIVPRELGGRGENHTCAAMVLETLARHGCPSTALVYTMHLTACAFLLKSHHDSETIKALLRRLDRDRLVGTTMHSDPASGGHFWFNIASKARFLDEQRVRLLKHGSWVTSAGHADWYMVQVASASRQRGDFASHTNYLVLRDEVRASADEWRALGMHGNMSGPVVVDGVFTRDRQIGADGQGQVYNDDGASWFLILSGSVWNGIAMACMDVTKKHVTRKTHGDVGMRVCDYASIQDYFGDCACSTNASRLALMTVASAMDAATADADWSRHADPAFKPYAPFGLWVLQAKLTAAKNVSEVTECMLRACGGAGFKEELGLERLLRDGKAGWLMAPSNEVIRQMIGKVALLGPASLDPWEQQVNRRVVHHELNKMTPDEKEALARQLLKDVQLSRGTGAGGGASAYQDTDFENPFNTRPPEHVQQTLRRGGVDHEPGLSPLRYTDMVLVEKRSVTPQMSAFTFRFAAGERHHLACLPGQYVQVRVSPAGRPAQERYLSPISRPDAAGTMEVVVKYETSGLLSAHLRAMTAGDTLQVRGPCGGFEHRPGALDHLLLLASGAGVTPCLQIVRSVAADPADGTRVTLLYHAATRQELLLEDELAALAASDRRFQLVFSLSEPPENWDGEEGFIDGAMIGRHVTAEAGSRRKVVLCGGPTMAVSALSCLRELGYSSDELFVYGQMGAEMVRMVFGQHAPLSGHTVDVE